MATLRSAPSLTRSFNRETTPRSLMMAKTTELVSTAGLCAEADGADIEEGGVAEGAAIAAHDHDALPAFDADKEAEPEDGGENHDGFCLP